MLFGRNNSAALARRDPARGALLGSISGSNFGRDPRPPVQGPPMKSLAAIAAAACASMPSHAFAGGTRFGREVQFGRDVQFGGDPWSYPGGSFGADAAPAPTPQAMQEAWIAKVRQDQAEARRNALLEPNKDVNAKVERYNLQTSQAITVGTALTGYTNTTSPKVSFRPQRVVSNAPCPSFTFLTQLSVANVNILVGSGVSDFWTYASESNDTSLDIPTLSPSNPVSYIANYTGLIPPAYNSGLATYNTLEFIGWASVIA